jgi:hypothetical protein
MKLRSTLLVLMAAMVMALLVGGGGAARAADQSKGASNASNSSSAPSESSKSSPLSAQASRIATKTFSNSSPIQIPGDQRAAQGRASTYPSEIAVSGFKKGSKITDVKVNLFGLSHGLPDDIDLLLVGPKGQNIIIMSDVGGSFPAQNLILSLDDAFESNGEGNLPDEGGIAPPNTFSQFAPTNVGSGDTFPAPAPTPSTANKLSVFNGTNPNGTWKLFAVDDNTGKREAGQPPDVGELAGGWSLEITAKSKH